MSIEQKVTNILFYYIKNKYKKYLSDNSLRYIKEDDIYKVVSDFYINDEKEIKKFIRETLKKMMVEYPGPLVENIILEIFSDSEVAINRVCMEIKLFQDSNKEELEKQIINNSYEVYLLPDKELGLGISLNVSTDEIKVTGFKRGDNDYILPAEKCNLISIGDRLIKVNNRNIDELGLNATIDLFRKINFDNKEVTLKLLNKSYI